MNFFRNKKIRNFSQQASVFSENKAHTKKGNNSIEGSGNKRISNQEDFNLKAEKSETEPIYQKVREEILHKYSQAIFSHNNFSISTNRKNHSHFKGFKVSQAKKIISINTF
jgi:hypothetical protein